MLCLVKQPNAVVLEIEVDPKADGQECLDKVLQHLGIIESDYFGLQYTSPKGEHMWLNLRNRISRQLGGTPPHRLQLRVKFFVAPHFLLQDATHHQFYLNVKQLLLSGQLKVEDTCVLVTLAALVAQAELGSYAAERAHLLLPQYAALLPTHDMTLLSQLINEHSKLQGTSEKWAQYRLLQETSGLQSYGVEYYAMTNCDSGQQGHIGVGPQGITMHDQEFSVLQHLEYVAMVTVTQDGRTLELTIAADDGSTSVIQLRLGSQKAATAIYRCVTEMYSFYRCDTVRNAVASQVCRDLKGTLASLFSENTTLGQKYVFDIQRTMREAHDHARRILYSLEQNLHSSQPQSESQQDASAEAQTGDVGEECLGAEGGVMEVDPLPCGNTHCQVVENSLQHVYDAFTCQICADKPLNTALCPCGHVVCCATCAPRMDTCPLCRSTIDKTQHIFLPDPISNPLASRSRNPSGNSVWSSSRSRNPSGSNLQSPGRSRNHSESEQLTPPRSRNPSGSCLLPHSLLSNPPGSTLQTPILPQYPTVPSLQSPNQLRNPPGSGLLSQNRSRNSSGSGFFGHSISMQLQP